MEVLKASLEREREEGGFELSLELSIGGNYGKFVGTQEMVVKNGDPFEENDKNVRRSDFSCNDKRDLESKRERITPQALRKQESCVEREDKLILVARQFQARVEDREDREKNGISEKLARKWEKNGTGESVDNLNGDFKGQQMQKGDNGETYASRSETRQNHTIPRSTKVKRLKVDNSDSRTQPEQCLCTMQTEKFKPVDHSNKTNNARSAVDDQTSRSTRQKCGPIRKPPKPPNHKIEGVPVRQMPCVSTTGNGPNGKTVSGFLYKYSKTEVSIVCVCHGRFFSPAEFVEHAGGVDISNPLRHITIVNSVR